MSQSGPVAKWQAASKARWSYLAETGVTETPSAEAVARAVARSAGATEPPTDLASVVRLWPGLRVSVEDLEGAGYLLDLGQAGGEILLRAADSLARRRFTLAHELGHWLMATPTAPQHGHDDRSVERWCDAFASELLLPHAWLASHLDVPMDALLSRLIALPERTRTSRTACFLRSAEVSGLSIWLSRGSMVIDRFHPPAISPSDRRERERTALRQPLDEEPQEVYVAGEGPAMLATCPHAAGTLVVLRPT